MSKIFNFPNCPYDEGDVLYRNPTIEFQPGLTVLVGCNGSGKTTMLDHIAEELRTSNIAYLYHNNTRDGGSYASSKAAFFGNVNLFATLATSSEGEQIIVNLGEMAKEAGRFVRHHKEKGTKEIWLLFDAIDSGLSIDNVLDIKTFLFNTILNDAKESNIDIYIVCSANSFEMCYKEKCIDVSTGNFIEFIDYGKYKDFILNSKKYKKERYDD